MSIKSLLTLIFLMTFSSFAFCEKPTIAELTEVAKQGSKSAIYALGVRYSNGEGVKVNRELANKYYAEAAGMGYAPAQNNLGWSYREGLGVDKNSAAAVFWFRLAAIQSNPLALQNLAEMYSTGEGVPKLPGVAEDLYRLCASQLFDTSEIKHERGHNNAIHECRRELGKIIAVRSKDEQKALRNAAFWFRASLVDNFELKEDSETALRSRRSLKETLELLDKINKKLTPQSKEWVDKNLKDWEDLREYILDTTPFPLTELDCTPDKMQL
jgi:Sel1 repeat